MSNNQQRRMYQRPYTAKPRVYKILPDGLWWASVADQDGDPHSDYFFEYSDAIAQAAKYAAGVYE